jgi:hypothetical protein
MSWEILDIGSAMIIYTLDPHFSQLSITIHLGMESVKKAISDHIRAKRYEKLYILGFINQLLGIFS